MGGVSVQSSLNPMAFNYNDPSIQCASPLTQESDDLSWDTSVSEVGQPLLPAPVIDAEEVGDGFLYMQPISESSIMGIHDGIDRDLALHPFVAIPMPHTPETFLELLKIAPPPEGSGSLGHDHPGFGASQEVDRFGVASLPMSSALHCLSDDLVVVKVQRVARRKRGETRSDYLSNLRQNLGDDELLIPSFIYNNMKKDRRCRIAVKIVPKTPEEPKIDLDFTPGTPVSPIIVPE